MLISPGSSPTSGATRFSSSLASGLLRGNLLLRRFRIVVLQTVALRLVLGVAMEEAVQCLPRIRLQVLQEGSHGSDQHLLIGFVSAERERLLLPRFQFHAQIALDLLPVRKRRFAKAFPQLAQFMLRVRRKRGYAVLFPLHNGVGYVQIDCARRMFGVVELPDHQARPFVSQPARKPSARR